MTLSDVWTELENDMEWRQGEVRLLSNSMVQLRHASERDQFRRVMLVMLYAHVEGFCKVAFSTYVRAVNHRALTCKELIANLAAASFEDVFHAVHYGDNKGKVFKSEPPTDEKLLVFSRRRDFFAEMENLLSRSAAIPDTVVNTEDNLGAMVLRRNLFRLGFDVDLLQHHEADLDELKNRRNNIAHGSDSTPVRHSDYERLRKVAFEAMDEVTLAIVAAVENERFLK